MTEASSKCCFPFFFRKKKKEVPKKISLNSSAPAPRSGFSEGLPPTVPTPNHSDVRRFHREDVSEHSRRRSSFDSVSSTPARKRSLFIETNLDLAEIRHTEMTPVGDLADTYKYNCPLCMRFFSHMLHTACCKRYVCHLCADDMRSSHSKAAAASLLRSHSSTTPSSANINSITANSPSRRMSSPSYQFSYSFSLDQKLRCPHCSACPVSLKDVDSAAPIQKYTDSPMLSSSSKKSSIFSQNQKPPGALPSPLRIGDSIEVMKSKMLSFETVGYRTSPTHGTSKTDSSSPSHSSDPHFNAMQAGIRARTPETASSLPPTGRRQDIADSLNSSNGFMSSNGYVPGSRSPSPPIIAGGSGEGSSSLASTPSSSVGHRFSFFGNSEHDLPSSSTSAPASVPLASTSPSSQPSDRPSSSSSSSAVPPHPLNSSQSIESNGARCESREGSVPHSFPSTPSISRSRWVEDENEAVSSVVLNAKDLLHKAILSVEHSNQELEVENLDNEVSFNHDAPSHPSATSASSSSLSASSERNLQLEDYSSNDALNPPFSLSPQSVKTPHFAAVAPFRSGPHSSSSLVNSSIASIPVDISVSSSTSSLGGLSVSDSLSLSASVAESASLLSLSENYPHLPAPSSSSSDVMSLTFSPGTSNHPSSPSPSLPSYASERSHHASASPEVSLVYSDTSVLSPNVSLSPAPLSPASASPFPDLHPSSSP